MTGWPGDDVVPDAPVVMDRETVLPGTAEQLWPWLVQLGKDRAGWYFPRWAERVIPERGRGLRHIDPALQHLEVGDVVPDWGPGDPEFELVGKQAPYTLVYLTERGGLRASWALVAEDTPGGVRLHLRFRARPARGWTVPVARVVGGFVDWATVQLLFAGLRERLSQGPRNFPG
jgi:hypothetical protein